MTHRALHAPMHMVESVKEKGTWNVFILALEQLHGRFSDIGSHQTSELVMPELLLNYDLCINIFSGENASLFKSENYEYNLLARVYKKFLLFIRIEYPELHLKLLSDGFFLLLFLYFYIFYSNLSLFRSVRF